jgi:hypothetical protein
MKQLLTFFFILSILSVVSSCNSVDRAATLQKCMALGDESIIYARANYVKLFHYFNPQKFIEPYQQVKEFDHVSHRNVINTYDIAIRKLKAKDDVTKALISACKGLSDFSKTLVDQSYPRAISHKSKFNPLSDNFFIEINQIVKFDPNIGEFDQSNDSFKQQVQNYKSAVKNYIKKYQAELPTELKIKLN